MPSTSSKVSTPSPVPGVPRYSRSDPPRPFVSSAKVFRSTMSDPRSDRLSVAIAATLLIVVGFAPPVAGSSNLVQVSTPLKTHFSPATGVSAPIVPPTEIRTQSFAASASDGHSPPDASNAALTNCPKTGSSTGVRRFPAASSRATLHGVRSSLGSRTVSPSANVPASN